MPKLSTVRTFIVNVRTTHVVHIRLRLEGGVDFSCLCLDGSQMRRSADSDNEVSK